jgi:hypothetical protein
MEAQAHLVKLSRRTVMLSGLVGVSALVLGKGGGALAQPGVEPKVIKETPSRIAGVPKVQLVEVTLQPGAVMPTSKMDSAMICECTRGALEVTLDENKKATMNTGHLDLWCRDHGGRGQPRHQRGDHAGVHLVDVGVAQRELPR